MATEPKTISLASEIYDLEHAVEALRLLVEKASEDALANADLARPTLRAASTVASLLEARCALLRRTVRGEVDPSFAWSERNAAVGDGDPDLLIPVWNDAERTEWHRRKLNRGQIHHGRRRRR